MTQQPATTVARELSNVIVEWDRRRLADTGKKPRRLEHAVNRADLKRNGLPSLLVTR